MLRIWWACAALAIVAAGPAATITLVPLGPLQLTACNWHPSLEDHQEMARVLERAVDADSRSARGG